MNSDNSLAPRSRLLYEEGPWVSAIVPYEDGWTVCTLVVIVHGWLHSPDRPSVDPLSVASWYEWITWGA